MPMLTAARLSVMGISVTHLVIPSMKKFCATLAQSSQERESLFVHGHDRLKNRHLVIPAQAGIQERFLETTLSGFPLSRE